MNGDALVIRRPLLGAGNPKVRGYEGVCARNNAAIGMFSDKVTATCQPGTRMECRKRRDGKLSAGAIPVTGSIAIGARGSIGQVPENISERL
jgi:hypothetical protein